MDKKLNKKGFFFTLLTLLLLLSILMFSKAYLYRDVELKYSVVTSFSISRLGMIEDDVLSNIFTDLLTTQIESITRTGTITINFNHSELVINRDYSTIMSDYETFVENTYDSKINTDINLHGFNNSFKIQPYDTKIVQNGETLYVYLMPPYSNVNSITINTFSDATLFGICSAPFSDPGGINVNVVFEDSVGGICSSSVNLDPNQNNDFFWGVQFYSFLSNPFSSVEVKFGQVNGTNGVLAILTNNANVNITQLSINYDLVPEKIYLESGSILIGDNKTSKIILAQE